MSKLTNLNNLDKLSKALDARYKELIDEEKARAIAEEQALQTEINVTKEMLGGKSIKYITQAEYDNLSEEEKNSSVITYFITDAVDLSHEHENKDILDFLTQDYFQNWYNLIESKSDKLYYSTGDDNVIVIDNLGTPILLDDTTKAYNINSSIGLYEGYVYNVIVRTTDGNELTTTSVKSSSGNINGMIVNNIILQSSNFILIIFDKLYLNTNINDLEYNQDMTFIQTLSVINIESITIEKPSIMEVTNDFLNEYRFVTEDEKELWNNKQEKEDESLNTEDKTIVGAINEVKDMLGGKSLRYVTQDEFDALSDEEKNDENIVWNITDAEEKLDAITLNGYSLWVGTTTELEAIENRDPNTLYFEIGEDSGDEVVQVDIVNGILQLTDDKYQKTEMVDGTEIVFPVVNKFTEIHLYFNGESNMQLTFPDCKWRVEPNIEEGNVYELIATYNTMNWLVNVITYS